MKVLTFGTFDVPHIGHTNFLRQCSMLGEVTIALNTDDFIERYKGKKPLFSYGERWRLLKLVPNIKEIIPNEGCEDSKPTILKVKPDIIAIGTDWVNKDYYSQMSFSQEWLDEQGIVLCYLPYLHGVSTTEIKKRINDTLGNNSSKE